MTAAHRATLARMEETLSNELNYVLGEVRDEDRMFWIAQERDALRAALGTCGNCAHAGSPVWGYEKTWQFCGAPDNEAFPFYARPMRVDQRCTGWTAKEDA